MHGNVSLSSSRKELLMSIYPKSEIFSFGCQVSVSALKTSTTAVLSIEFNKNMVKNKKWPLMSWSLEIDKWIDSIR